MGRLAKPKPHHEGAACLLPEEERSGGDGDEGTPLTEHNNETEDLYVR
jgi:hypothetical protein